MLSDKNSPLVRLSNCGIVFLLTWIVLLFETDTVGANISSTLMFMGSEYLWSVLFLLITIALVAFLPIDRRRFLSAPQTMIAAPLVMTIGTGLCFLSGFGYGLGFTIAGGALTGVSSAILSLQWVVVFQSLGFETTAVNYPVLLAFTVCLGITLLYLPSSVIVGAMLVFPLISGALLWISMKVDRPDPALDRFKQARFLNYFFFIMFVAVFGLSSGYLDYITETGIYTNIFYALVTLAILATAGAFIFLTDRTDFFTAFLIPLAFLVVALVPYAVLYHIDFNTHFVIVGDLCIEVMMFVTALCFSDYLFTRPIATYALCRITFALANSAGWVIAEFVMKTQGNNVLDSQIALISLFIGLQVLVMVLIIVVAINWRKGARMKVTTLTSMTASEDSASPLDMRCLAIGKQYGLSGREIDVMRLLARGYSSSKIQQELFIAAGTVNFHTRNIYTKLNIHSKQEVIDLIGS